MDGNALVAFLLVELQCILGHVHGSASQAGYTLPRGGSGEPLPIHSRCLIRDQLTSIPLEARQVPPLPPMTSLQRPFAAQDASQVQARPPGQLGFDHRLVFCRYY